MIIIDSSETKTTSNTARIPNAIKCNWLEERTGADIAISPLDGIPFAPRTLGKHIEKGMLLVQIKNGFDLASSVGNRMNTSLAKMIDVTPRQCQRVLLFVGILTCDREGKALINGSKPMKTTDYWSVIGALDKWTDRGGIYKNISRKSLLPQWANRKEIHLKHYLENQIKVIAEKPKLTEIDPNEPLQDLKLIKDGRITLATLPGIGEKKIKILWEIGGGNLADLLCWLTDPDEKHNKKVPGIGPKTIENIRNYFGLTERIILTQDLKEYPEEKKKDA